MTALLKIKNAGFNVSLHGDSFKIIPSSLLTNTQRDFLKSHKAEIIEELQQADTLTVICYTPLGHPMIVRADSAKHAQFLRLKNPKPTNPIIL
ncbi:MAG: hypothetical protein RLZZ419_1636 [Pseudomonadota bacterium]